MNTNVSKTKVIRINSSENVTIVATQVKCENILVVSVQNEQNTEVAAAIFCG